MFGGIDLSVILIACGCCIALFFLGSILSIVTIGLDILSLFINIIGGIFDIISGILGGGPGGCCGCLVLIALLLSCGVLAWSLSDVLSTCNTPDAVNFCRIFS